ncbi:hypothetical protein ILYODFUR_035101 [Ilyodon furcidens]|uniref:Mitochondrial ribosomal protein L55 n=1 Tax=Ilyodon furcidens TaxID=33524 RepID=A0ABV0VKC1_9TELE
MAQLFLKKLHCSYSSVTRCILPCLSRPGCQPVFPAVTTSLLHSHGAQFSSNRTSVVRCGRQSYERQYPVLLVRPDGSTVSIRYQEPRRLILVSNFQGFSVQRFYNMWTAAGYILYYE